MDINSIGKLINADNIEKNAKKGIQELEKLSNNLAKIQANLEKMSFPLENVFKVTSKFIEFTNKTLSYVATSLEDKTSSLSRVFNDAEIIYNKIQKSFLNENSNDLEKFGAGFSIASDLTNITASLTLDDDSYQEYLDQRNQYIKDANESVLSGASDMFDDMANIANEYLGRQNDFYKTLFRMSKAFSIAKSIMSIKTAIADAAASGSFPANLAAIATVVASTANIISDIQAVKYTGQAHDGINYVPREGTWLLDKGERVVDARTNKDLKNFLQTSNQMKSGFSVNVPVTISNDNLSAEDGKQLGVIIKQSVMNIILEQQRPGGILNR